MLSHIYYGNGNLLRRTDIFLNAHIKNTQVFNNASKTASGLNKVTKIVYF